MDDATLLALVQSLSLREKAALCSGADSWTTKAIPAKGIPSLRMADGPHGLRLEEHGKQAEKANGGASRRSTCFPTQAALACSFSPALVRRVGEAIAVECLANGVGLLLGPGVNCKRSPLGGRNFEYYSEDPLLSGELAAGFIAGVQSRGVGASLKHYAVNDQESWRLSISAAVDDRAFFDIYLKPFEIAVKKAAPATVMTSYNRVNGVYASENRRLLTDILRLRFGFAGAVVSDWGAVNDRVAGIAAGMDLEMPSSGGANDYAVEQAVKDGRLSEDALDVVCWNLLRLILPYSKENAPCPTADFSAHHALAVEALCQSAVLLKNEDMLPLSGGEKLAVVGEMAAKPRYQGGGSSLVNPACLVSFTDAMRAKGRPFTYAAGYTRSGEATDALLQQAIDAAQTADKVLLFLGLPGALESEGDDRTHLRLPEGQLRLLAAVAQVNRNIIVVLHCGAPVEAPWLGDVRALLCLYLGGEGVGEATLRLLYGQANPAGRLAESWPLRLEDTPAYHHFPMGPNEVTYNESIFVGYRYYDTAQQPVLFPFGYGLSYTRFSYSGLHLEDTHLAKGEALRLRFTLSNVGRLPGEEVVQVYVVRKTSATFQPARELKAFCRVALDAQEQKEISLDIPYEELGFYDTASSYHLVEAGGYEVQVGPNSRQLPLVAVFEAEGVSLPFTALPAATLYAHPKDNAFPSEAFSAIYTGGLLGNAPVHKGQYDHTTPLGLMNESFWGRRLLGLAVFIAKRTIRFSADPVHNAQIARHMAAQMPFKNVMLNTGGRISPAAADALLSACNGQGGFGRFMRLLLARPPYRKRKPEQ